MRRPLLHRYNLNPDFRPKEIGLSILDRGTHGMPLGDEATIAALAEETRTDQAVVQSLYEEEFAVLEAQSSVKNFIGVIAARRVRERLAVPRSPSHPVDARAGRPDARAERRFRAA
jgi:hypothetical protein